MERDSSAFRKQRVILTPQNQSSSGFYSATTFPLIQFVVGTQRGMIDKRTLRLNYTYKVVSSASVGAGGTPGGVVVANVPTDLPSGTNGIGLNFTTGTLSSMSQVQCNSRNGRNIETILNFNQYLSIFKPNMNNQYDMINTLSAGDPTVSDKSVCTTKVLNSPNGFSVSVPLETGFLTGEGLINVSEKGFHGINLNILLDQNANVLGPYELFTQGIKGRPAPTLVQSTANYEYQMSNVFLSYDTYIPDDRIYDSMPSSGTIEFNSINTLLSTLVASDSTTTLRLGIKNCLSISQKLVSSNHLNNQNMNSLALERPSTDPTISTLGTVAPFNNIQYFRGGVLYPYDYILDSQTQALNNPQPQIEEPARHSINLYDDGHQSMNPLTNSVPGLNLQPSFVSNGKGKGMNFAQVQDPVSNFIFGIPCDSQRVGADYSTRDYAFRINSGLNGLSPFQVFTFARARNVAAYSPTGIDIIE